MKLPFDNATIELNDRYNERNSILLSMDEADRNDNQSISLNFLDYESDGRPLISEITLSMEDAIRLRTFLIHAIPQEFIVHYMNSIKQ